MMPRLSCSLLAVLLLATGCSDQALYFEQRTQLETAATSLALFDDGARGQGSMNAQTCEFDAWRGTIVGDVDLPTADERIEDLRGPITLARSAEGLHILDENGWDSANDLPIRGVRHARMTAAGVVALVADASGCRVEWREQDGARTVALPEAACTEAAGFAADPVSARAWVGDGAEVWQADPVDGARSVSVAADQLAYDEAARPLYLARRGVEGVTAIAPSGSVLWTARTGGPVHALTDFGALGAVAVVVESGSAATIEVLEGASGAPLASYDLPAVAEAVISADASTLALVTEEAVHLYDVLDGEAPVRFNEVVTEPPVMFD
jgi:hypothetical protein